MENIMHFYWPSEIARIKVRIVAAPTVFAGFRPQ